MLKCDHLAIMPSPSAVKLAKTKAREQFDVTPKSIDDTKLQLLVLTDTRDTRASFAQQLGESEMISTSHRFLL